MEGAPVVHFYAKSIELPLSLGGCLVVTFFDSFFQFGEPEKRPVFRRGLRRGMRHRRVSRGSVSHT